MTSTPQGLLEHPDYDLAGVVLASWDAFITLVDDADPTAKTRLDGWSVRDIVLHLGTWDGASALTGVLASLQSGGSAKPTDADAFNAQVLAKHGDATDADVRAALAESRDAVGRLLESDDARERGGDLVTGPLGQMPLLTVVHAGCYELAVHALDVAAATDATVDPALLRHGIAALADSTGCLAARSGIDATIGIVADEAPWSFEARSDGGWTTAVIDGDPHGPRISGSAVDILEASSDRADPIWLVTRRRIKVKHVGGLTALTPIIDQVPGLPGGRALKGAAKTLGGFFNH